MDLFCIYVKYLYINWGTFQFCRAILKFIRNIYIGVWLEALMNSVYLAWLSVIVSNAIIHINHNNHRRERRQWVLFMGFWLNDRFTSMRNDASNPIFVPRNNIRVCVCVCVSKHKSTHYERFNIVKVDSRSTRSFLFLNSVQSIYIIQDWHCVQMK